MQTEEANRRLVNCPEIFFCCECMLKMIMFPTLTVLTVDIRFYPQDWQIRLCSAGGRHLAQRCSRSLLNLKRRLARSILIGSDAVRLPAMSQTNQPKYELIVRKDSEGWPHPWRDILRAMDAGGHRNRR